MKLYVVFPPNNVYKFLETFSILSYLQKYLFWIEFEIPSHSYVQAFYAIVRLRSLSRERYGFNHIKSDYFLSSSYYQRNFLQHLALQNLSNSLLQNSPPLSILSVFISRPVCFSTMAFHCLILKNTSLLCFKKYNQHQLILYTLQLQHLLSYQQYQYFVSNTSHRVLAIFLSITSRNTLSGRDNNIILRAFVSVLSHLATSQCVASKNTQCFSKTMQILYLYRVYENK